MSDQIKNWIQTCDLLTENRHFNEQKCWKVPTFQPWYHYDAYLCLQQYFLIKHRISDPQGLTKVARQQQSAQKMFDTWEEVCFRVFQSNHTPIPKCLWYYKIKYTQRNETQTWKNFFHDTPFQTWGYVGEGEGNDKGENNPAENKNTNQSTPDGKHNNKTTPDPQCSPKPSNKRRPKNQN
jgi:hypothetical protein